MINIFESITEELYDWAAVEFDGKLIDTIEKARCGPSDTIADYQFGNPVPIRSVAGIYYLDTALTQKWLQAMARKLSMDEPSLSRSTGVLLPLHFLVTVAKAVMDVFQGSALLRSLHVSDLQLPKLDKFSSQELIYRVMSEVLPYPPWVMVC